MASSSSSASSSLPPTPRSSSAAPWGSRSYDQFIDLHQVGQGTFGQVYRARNKATNEIVALKRIKMDGEKEGFPITAIREIKILKELNDENVVRLLEVVTEKTASSDSAHNMSIARDGIYMVFEFMNHDLTGMIESGVRFTEPQMKCLMKQLLSGLHYCHKQGILHRDIKPSNLLVNNDGILKIADFGLARPVGDVYAGNILTNRVVTLWYRAPELLLGSDKYTSAIDMWSAGCILAELILRQALLTGKDESEQIHKIYQLCGTPGQPGAEWPSVGDLRDWSSFRPRESMRRTVRDRFKGCDVSSDALDLIDKLLCLDPEKRITADGALDHAWFWNDTPPCKPFELPKFSDSKHEWSERQKRSSSRRDPRQQQHPSSLPPSASSGPVHHHHHQQQYPHYPQHPQPSHRGPPGPTPQHMGPPHPSTGPHPSSHPLPHPLPPQHHQQQQHQYSSHPPPQHPSSHQKYPPPGLPIPHGGGPPQQMPPHMQQQHRGPPPPSSPYVPPPQHQQHRGGPPPPSSSPYVPPPQQHQNLRPPMGPPGPQQHQPHSQQRGPPPSHSSHPSMSGLAHPPPTPAGYSSHHAPPSSQQPPHSYPHPHGHSAPRGPPGPVSNYDQPSAKRARIEQPMPGVVQEVVTVVTTRSTTIQMPSILGAPPSHSSHPPSGYSRPPSSSSSSSR